MASREVDAYVFYTVGLLAWMVTYCAYRVGINWISPLLAAMYMTLLWGRAFKDVIREEYELVCLPEARARWKP